MDDIVCSYGYIVLSHMDEQIGRILVALEKTGKKDNTYILFSADHGLACGNHGADSAAYGNGETLLRC